MDLLPFLLALLHVHKALCAEISWDSTVKLTKQLSLECAHLPTQILTQIEWLKRNGQKEERIAIFNPILGLEITAPYTNRVSIKNSSEASNIITLNFNNASDMDAGLYTCRLNMFPDGSAEKIIQVAKTDKFESIALLNETIPELVTESGQNITLNYQFQMKGPVKTVIWEKIQPHQIDILTSCDLLEGSPYTSKYQNKVWATCRQGSRVSILFIPNVTVSESAIYCCLVEATTGEKESYMVRLIVYGPKQGGNIQMACLKSPLECRIRLGTGRGRPSSSQEASPQQTFALGLHISDNRANNSRSPVSYRQAKDHAQDDIYVNYPTMPQKTKSKV
ncbi:PREDICTED: CD226 antigen isoform X2 [Dipodomys ordii]|uniref:CD226 antigen isoform X2 n=1 Tax=Dipodomys ordii TaxID=10020 RepID=A0A1S3FCX3_DIPOR|nr:PREDICTED: CD226 antigen isoform X2 [Dipodomys ordii]